MTQISTTFALTAEKQLIDGQFEEAITTCKEGLSVYPNYPSAMCILAKAYYFAGDFTSAQSLIDTAFETFPTNLAVVKIKNAIFEHTLEMNFSNDSLSDSLSENIFKEEENFADSESIETEYSEENIFNEENIFDNSKNDICNDIEQAPENKLHHINGIEKIMMELKSFDKSDINDIIPEEIEEEISMEEESFDDDFDFKQNEYVEVENIAEETNTTKLISDLYRIDLELPRIIVEETVGNYLLNHLEAAIDCSEINFFFNASDEFFIVNETRSKIAKSDFASNYQPIGCDTKTQDLLDIAKGLENAKITPVLEDIDEEEEQFETPLVASETMAKILIKQNAIDKAIKVYQMLIIEKPEKADYYKEQIENISS